MKKLLAALAVTTIAAGSAFAQDAFATADTDASGTISLEEATAAGVAEDVFGAADADGDGQLTPEEFASIPS